ncbi:MAG: FAD-dependent oxidoreductase [Hyphomicrobiales bacterium]|nr:FAD-dependent oxidoreductase [Hyphomicrobiales bacterium]
MSGTLVIGGGQAAAQLAISLRADGYVAPVRILGQEVELPYQRPPLSKGFLKQETTEAQLELRPADFWSAQRIEIMRDMQAISIDRDLKRVTCADGSQWFYDHLVLATGSRNRPLSLEGHNADGVYALRSLEDARRLREAFASARHIVVIGGGFIGLEFAAVARKLGRAVTIIEMADRLMARAVGAQISDWYLRLHAGHGTDVRLGSGVKALEVKAGRIVGVTLADGTALPCDLLVYGIGAMANLEIARACGLETGAGIRVDAFMQSADPQVLAIGDCAEAPSKYFHAGAFVRLESVQNAVDQAKCAARTISGARQAFDVVPWFWTDQFEAKLQIAGLSAGASQQVIRGTPESGRFSVFYFMGDKLIAVDSVNMAADHLLARRLLAGGRAITPQQAGDLATDLKTLL